MWSFYSKISEYPFSFFTESTIQMSLGILQIVLYHCDHTSTPSLSSIKAYAIRLLHSHDALLDNWDDYVMPSGRTCHTEWLIYLHWSRGYLVSRIRTKWNDLRLNTRLRITCNLKFMNCLFLEFHTFFKLLFTSSATIAHSLSQTICQIENNYLVRKLSKHVFLIWGCTFCTA